MASAASSASSPSVSAVAVAVAAAPEMDILSDDSKSDEDNHDEVVLPDMLDSAQLVTVDPDAFLDSPIVELYPEEGLKGQVVLPVNPQVSRELVTAAFAPELADLKSCWSWQVENRATGEAVNCELTASLAPVGFEVITWALKDAAADDKLYARYEQETIPLRTEGSDQPSVVTLVPRKRLAQGLRATDSLRVDVLAFFSGLVLADGQRVRVVKIHPTSQEILEESLAEQKAANDRKDREEFVQQSRQARAQQVQELAASLQSQAQNVGEGKLGEDYRVFGARFRKIDLIAELDKAAFDKSGAKKGSGSGSGNARLPVDEKQKSAEYAQSGIDAEAERFFAAVCSIFRPLVSSVDGISPYAYCLADPWRCFSANYEEISKNNCIMICVFPEQVDEQAQLHVDFKKRVPHIHNPTVLSFWAKLVRKGAGSKFVIDQVRFTLDETEQLTLHAFDRGAVDLTLALLPAASASVAAARGWKQKHHQPQQQQPPKTAVPPAQPAQPAQPVLLAPQVVKAPVLAPAPAPAPALPAPVPVPVPAPAPVAIAAAAASAARQPPARQRSKGKKKTTAAVVTKTVPVPAAAAAPARKAKVFVKPAAETLF